MNALLGSRIATLIAGLSLCGAAVAASGGSDDRIERGRYVVSIAACNDCHTDGYAESGGGTPQDRWLTGSTMGFQGPWGTTYPANLRLLMAGMSEDEWVQHARRATRPPMPWFILRDMSEDDLKAVYRFVRSLGPAGEPAPEYVPPGAAVTTPHIVFVPQNLPTGPETSQR